MPNEPEPTNPFVRFKHLVDDQISQTVRSIWSLPASSSSSSSNRANQDNNGSRPLGPGGLPISLTNDQRPFAVLGKVREEDITPEMRQLAKDIEANPGVLDQDPFDREVEALEGAVWRSLRDKTIQSWVKYSAYSPLRLQDTLPQPVPKDVPASSYPSGNEPQEQYRFTFRDAFEDLLAVSSGQPLKPLPELESRLRTPRRPGSLFLELSSAKSWRDWTANIERRYLWDAYFPPENFGPAAERIATIATSDLFRRELTADQAERYIHKFVGDAAACPEERRWRRADVFGPGGLGFGPATSPVLGALLGLYGGSRGVLDDDEMEHHFLTPVLAAAARDVFMAGARDEHGRRLLAETEEDLYRNVESDELAPPTAVVHRSPQGSGESGGIVTKSAGDSDNNKNEEWTEVYPEPDGGKTEKSVTRKVGPWMTHETVTTTRYDADGNVVQRMSQRQHSASKEFRWSSSSASEEDDKNSQDERENKSSSSGKGWFWTK
ncbi:hypothetical protein PG996_011841 [Apiospora saccharicola]|uniref:Uncharacterized protein n=1 Tax=Apiospora saccharicola TaxID=335842 RepID=A0ABR1UJ68_9PEZI